MTGPKGSEERVDPGLSRHPSPQRERATPVALAFATMAAPLAWFLQLTINYAVLSQPCFASTERLTHPLKAANWTLPAAAVIYVVCLAAGIAALLVAIALYRRARSERAGHVSDFQEAGSGRTRFLAYWGILLGLSFTVVTAVNLLALLMVPTCAW